MGSTSYTMKSSGPPAGAHPAEFVGIEPFTGGDDTKSFGPAVLLKWKVTHGDHTGEEITCICSAKLSQKSKLGKMAVALKGGPISLGEDFDFASYFGVVGTLLVEETGEGSARVTSFIRTGGPKQ